MMDTMKERITLRALTIQDTDILMALTGNPEVVRYLPGMIQDRRYAAAWIEGLTADDHELMVLLDGRVIGECSLTVHGGSGEIGLMLFPDYWRKGCGTETVLQLTALAGKLGLREITAFTSPKNTACIGLLQKLGFARHAAGWILDEADPEKGPDQLFSTEFYQKNIEGEKANENDICRSGEGTEKTQ